MDQPYLTEHDLRTVLVARVDEYCRLTGTSITPLSKAITNDTACLAQVKNGRNIGINLYQRVMSWLDEHWPTAKEIVPQSERMSAP